ncbi:hypothetical protein [Novosphingobium sp. PY1]|uniref:DUF4258 domain-containing protein n=1 Tax=Ochrobactrum sp. PW1 TaxID=1882222 RepID=A0A292GMM4_9HYPH|nr:hypothetical protein [Novosphingobium sp. PY1]BBA74404.1 hypothetical protein [Ochrobactrum sp. PW1]GFM29253.1 uncharacterized protein PY1_contig-07-179 [Novosphingobium sp. PY1]
MIRVSSHAISRYMERVRRCTDEEARAALSTPAVQCAADFGCECVRLPGGQRIIIRNFVVVTVQPATNYRRQVRRLGLSRYGRGNREEGE